MTRRLSYMSDDGAGRFPCVLENEARPVLGDVTCVAAASGFGGRFPCAVSAVPVGVSPCRRCAVLTPVRWCAAEHDMDGAPVLHPSGQKHVVVLGMLWQWHGDPWLVAG
eukprot:3627570-Rhodomonas_salina.3